MLTVFLRMKLTPIVCELTAVSEPWNFPRHIHIPLKQPLSPGDLE